MIRFATAIRDQQFALPARQRWQDNRPKNGGLPDNQVYLSKYGYPLLHI